MISTQKGMTLVEIVVALGISSVMMLGIMSVTQMANKSARNVGINADWANLKSNIRLAMLTPSACSSVVTNGAAGMISVVPAVADNSFGLLPTFKTSIAAAPLFTVNSPYGKILVTDMRVTQTRSQSTVQASFPTSGGNITVTPVTYQLSVKAEKVGADSANVGGITLGTDTFDIVAMVDANRKVWSCQGNGNTTENVCAELGGIYDATADGIIEPKCQIQSLRLTSQGNSPTSGQSEIRFGDPPTTSAAQYIRSVNGSNSLHFGTASKDRVSITASGDLTVRENNDCGSPVCGATDKRSVLNLSVTGGLASIYYDHNTTTLTLGVNNNYPLYITANAVSIDGSLTVNSVGGNVPFDCAKVGHDNVTTPAPPDVDAGYTYTCPADKPFAMGGGAKCGLGHFLVQSRPGMNDNEWHAGCASDNTATTKTKPVFVTITCCSM